MARLQEEDRTSTTLTLNTLRTELTEAQRTREAAVNAESMVRTLAVLPSDNAETAANRRLQSEHTSEIESSRRTVQTLRTEQQRSEDLVRTLRREFEEERTAHNQEAGTARLIGSGAL